MGWCILNRCNNNSCKHRFCNNNLINVKWIRTFNHLKFYLTNNYNKKCEQVPKPSKNHKDRIEIEAKKVIVIMINLLRVWVIKVRKIIIGKENKKHCNPTWNLCPSKMLKLDKYNINSCRSKMKIGSCLRIM
jgi:hypothetical protein